MNIVVLSFIILEITFGYLQINKTFKTVLRVKAIVTPCNIYCRSTLNNKLELDVDYDSNSTLNKRKSIYNMVNLSMHL